MLKHTIVTTPILIIGKPGFLTGKLRKAAFISWIPCVIGKMLITFCIKSGMTSKGSVAPENINIGKYNAHAITLAVLVFWAMPPTIIPMLKVDTIVSSQLPRKPAHEPYILIFQNIIPAAIKVTIDTIQQRI